MKVADQGAKEAIGSATGSKRTEAEGAVEETKGAVRERVGQEDGEDPTEKT